MDRDSASKLFAYDDGPRQAPVVVALHSVATHSAFWAGQMPIWSRTWRVVRVDLPGHGRSPNVEGADTLAGMGDAVCAALTDLGIERATFVGVSLGGMVAQAIALSHPARVHGLVLADAPARTPPEARALWQERLATARAKGMASQVEASLARWFTPDFRRRSPLTMAWIADMVTATSLVGYERAAHAIVGLDHVEALARITAPTLVLTGDHDTVVPPDVARPVATAIPKAAFAVLEHAAHLANVEAAVPFAEVTGAFFNAL
jgi:3-oxoadipate enol-lactonase